MTILMKDKMALGICIYNFLIKLYSSPLIGWCNRTVRFTYLVIKLIRAVYFIHWYSIKSIFTPTILIIVCKKKFNVAGEIQ